MQSTLTPFGSLKLLVQDDEDYAWTLHCNIAMPIMDELHCSHQDANMAAARVMQHWFGVDVTKTKNWKLFLTLDDWKSNKT